MFALEALLWILAGIGGLVLLSAIAVILLLVWVASVGFRRMRDDDQPTINTRTGRADR